MSTAPSPIPTVYVCQHCGKDHNVIIERRDNLASPDGSRMRYTTSICMGAQLQIHFNGDYQKKEVWREAF